MFRLKKVAHVLGNHLDKNNPKQVLTEKMKTASPCIQKSTNNSWKCKCISTENCYALVLYEKVLRLRKPTPKLQKELEHIGMIHEMLIYIYITFVFLSYIACVQQTLDIQGHLLKFEVWTLGPQSNTVTSPQEVYGMTGCLWYPKNPISPSNMASF